MLRFLGGSVLIIAMANICYHFYYIDYELDEPRSNSIDTVQTELNSDLVDMSSEYDFYDLPVVA